METSQQAQAANLNIDYIQQDIRYIPPHGTHDFIMMTFGELNVFSAADFKASSVIARSGWLRTANCLLKCIPSMKLNAGAWRSGWQRCHTACFLPDASAVNGKYGMKRLKTSSTLFWAMWRKRRCTTRFGSQMKTGAMMNISACLVMLASLCCSARTVTLAGRRFCRQAVCACWLKSIHF